MNIFPNFTITKLKPKNIDINQDRFYREQKMKKYVNMLNYNIVPQLPIQNDLINMKIFEDPVISIINKDKKFVPLLVERTDIKPNIKPIITIKESKSNTFDPILMAILYGCKCKKKRKCKCKK